MFLRLWTGYSKDKERQNEKKLLVKWGHLEPASYHTKETVISDLPDDQIHSVTIHNTGKTPLVLIPGYGASAGMYYKIMKGLSKQYEVHVVDARGMGSSGRPKFSPKDRVEAENFMVEGIEKWREKNNIDKFILCGHSLGGYLATKYAAQNKNKVLSLILISPAGVWGKPPNIDKKISERIKAEGFLKKTIFSIVKSNYWKPGKSPFSLFRLLGRTSNVLLKKYTSLYPKLSFEEKKDMQKFLYQIIANKGTGEFVMPFILEPGAFAVDPLINILKGITIPTAVYFGEKDWMRFGRENNSIQSANPKIRQRLISGASHNIHLDEPEALQKVIVEDLNDFLKDPNTRAP